MFARKQSGIATILIVLTIGIAVLVSTMGVMYHLRATQQRNLAVHSAAGSQAKAWQGVEVVRRYLTKVDPQVLAQWGNSTEQIVLKIGDGQTYQATLTTVTNNGTSTNEANQTVRNYLITANVTAIGYKDSPSQSTSTIETTYEVAAKEGTTVTPNPTPPVSTGAINVFNIKRDLNMTGGIKVIGGKTANFNVDGNVKLDSASIDGINTINSTGNVSIGSGIKVNTVWADGDVNLTGSAGVGQIKNRGNVTISGGTSSLAIHSNGVVNFQGGQAASVQSKQGVNVTAGGVNVSSIETEGAVNWSGSGGGVNTAKANGSITYNGGNNSTSLSSGNTVTILGGGANKVIATGNFTNQGYGTIGTADVGKDVFVPSSGGITTLRTKGSTSMTGSGNVNNIAGEKNLLVSNYQAASGKIGGTLNKTQQWNGSVNVQVVPGLKVDVEQHKTVQIPEVPKIELPTNQVVDVYTLKPAANYIFEYISGQIVITVNAVSGIPAGSYVLGNKQENGTKPQWLCKVSDMSASTCTKPVANICQGFSEYNGCFAYDANAKKWTVNGQTMARGIAWFEGNLEIGNGVYVNTWLATGNINTAGGHRTTSPNYAGYDVTCNNARPKNSSLPINPLFVTLIPTNLCAVPTKTMVPNALGNSAYIAGGYNPTTGNYGGGVVTLGASTIAEGNVVGADVVNTGGSTTIKGSVLANGQNTTNTKPMEFSGSTTIDLSGGSENYDPSVIPCMKDCTTAPVDNGSTIENFSQVKWSRYR